MKKFWIGLREGTWTLRAYILAIPVCILAGTALIVVSFCLNRMWLFLAGIALLVGAIALILNYNIEETADEEPEEPAQPDGARRKPERSAEGGGTEEPDTEDDKEPDAEDDGELDGTKRKKEKKPKKPKQKKPKKERTDRPEPDEEEADVSAEQLPDTPEEPDPEARADELTEYDEKKIKQVFYRYKVKQEHETIMIDDWKEKGVHQCPAYIWRQRNQAHFLIIADGVQEYSVALSRLATLKYHRGIVCQASEEYLQFRKESLLKTVFSPYLPVYHQGNRNGRPVVYKNLFELGDGILVTNTSVRILLSMLQPEIQIDDIVMRDVRYNGFLKEIYKQSILFRNQVIDARRYQESVKENLNKLAAADVSDREYEDTLQAMYQNRLITQEYIEYYRQYRERLRKDTASDGGKSRGGR